MFIDNQRCRINLVETKHCFNSKVSYMFRPNLVIIRLTTRKENINTAAMLFISHSLRDVIMYKQDIEKVEGLRNKNVRICKE